MKKRSLFPILLIGFTLGLTSCNEDSKKEDITTNPFANLPADSGQKPTTEQMDAAIANYKLCHFYMDVTGHITLHNTPGKYNWTYFRRNKNTYRGFSVFCGRKTEMEDDVKWCMQIVWRFAQMTTG